MCQRGSIILYDKCSVVVISFFLWKIHVLTHWGRETHICFSKLSIICSDNGLSPGSRQAIIWTSAGILSIGPIETTFNEILIEIHTSSFKKIHFKMSSGKWRSFCVGHNVLSLPHPLGLLHWYLGNRMIACTEKKNNRYFLFLND